MAKSRDELIRGIRESRFSAPTPKRLNNTRQLQIRQVAAGLNNTMKPQAFRSQFDPSLDTGQRKTAITTNDDMSLLNSLMREYKIDYTMAKRIVMESAAKINDAPASAEDTNYYNKVNSVGGGLNNLIDPSSREFIINPRQGRALEGLQAGTGLDTTQPGVRYGGGRDADLGKSVQFGQSVFEKPSQAVGLGDMGKAMVDNPKLTLDSMLLGLIQSPAKGAGYVAEKAAGVLGREDPTIQNRFSENVLDYATQRSALIGGYKVGAGNAMSMKSDFTSDATLGDAADIASWLVPGVGFGKPLQMAGKAGVRVVKSSARGIVKGTIAASNYVPVPIGVGIGAPGVMPLGVLRRAAAATPVETRAAAAPPVETADEIITRLDQEIGGVSNAGLGGLRPEVQVLIKDTPRVQVLLEDNPDRISRLNLLTNPSTSSRSTLKALSMADSFHAVSSFAAVSRPVTFEKLSKRAVEAIERGLNPIELLLDGKLDPSDFNTLKNAYTVKYRPQSKTEFGKQQTSTRRGGSVSMSDKTGISKGKTPQMPGEAPLSERYLEAAGSGSLPHTIEVITPTLRPDGTFKTRTFTPQQEHSIPKSPAGRRLNAWFNSQLSTGRGAGVERSQKQAKRALDAIINARDTFFSLPPYYNRIKGSLTTDEFKQILWHGGVVDIQVGGKVSQRTLGPDREAYARFYGKDSDGFFAVDSPVGKQLAARQEVLTDRLYKWQREYGVPESLVEDLLKYI